MRLRRWMAAAGLAAAAGAVVWWQITPGTRTLTEDETWSPDHGPHVVTEVVRIPKGVTLTIQPGSAVHFGWRTKLIVEGRLVCEGNALRGILLTRRSSTSWGGIAFRDTMEDNRLHYVSVEHSGTGEACLDLQGSRLSIEHAAFKSIRHTVIRTHASSLRVRHSTFFWPGENEVIFGVGIPDGGEVLIENNTFHPNRGYKDIIDFSNCRRPGPIPRFVGNVFLGGEDDGLDLDRCDAEVVGNVFTGFHSNADNHWANAISLADGSRVTVKNNICADNDHGIAAYHGAVLTAVRNTLYGNRVAAVNLEEDDLPGGATLDLCILWNNGASFRGREHATKLTVTRCVLPEATDWPDAGNLAQDPRFRDAKNGNFLPAKDSPAAGRGADLSRPPTSLFK